MPAGVHHHRTTLRGLRTTLLSVLAEVPPADPVDIWFHDDLAIRPREELLRERERIRLRLLFTGPAERSRWPAVWFVQRLTRIDQLLKAVPGPGAVSP